MSIKSGQRYKISNEESGLVFDLSSQRYKIANEESGLIFEPSGGKNKSVISWDFHGFDNQQWITEKQDDGQWTIRSVRHQKYLGFDCTPVNGIPVQVVGLDKPQFWDIEILSESEDHDNPRVKIWLRGTLLVVELPKGRSTPAPLQLRGAQEGKNQIWVLEEWMLSLMFWKTRNVVGSIYRRSTERSG
ncbi:hypothetical protein EI94DRAFT_1703161 [Lactarius quietus]|nr:hypothetical protein EI94DRAFT_1703161 [Lactarius quietus]